MLSPSDTVIIFVVALLLFGPEHLPKIARQLGDAMRHVQNTTSTFMAEMDRAAAASDMKAAAQWNPPPATGWEEPPADGASSDESSMPATAQPLSANVPELEEPPIQSEPKNKS